MAESYTRRDLVRKGSLLAGAAGAASLAGVPGLERALAAVGGELSPARRATYAALVEAVALAGTSEVSDKDLQGTTDEFADFYADADAPVRANVDVVLDTLEGGEGRTRFSSMDKRARLQQLRKWLGADPGARSEASGRNWRMVVPMAVDLAALPFYPRGPWERAPVVTL